MGFDVRLALGGFFSLIGALLAVFGAVSPAALFQRSLGINVDLWWGLAQLVFGLCLLAGVAHARRAGRRARTPERVRR